MIRIVRASDSDTRLWIEVKPTLPLTESIWFKHECANITERNLLEPHLRDHLHAQMALIRQLSYNRGWREKTQKTCRKTTDFIETTAIMDWERTEGR